MSLSSSHLFLLFLLLIIFLLAPLLRAVWKRAARPGNPGPRVPVLPFARSGVNNVSGAVTACGTVTYPPTMTQAPIVRREDSRSHRWKIESEATIEKYLVPDINVNLGDFIRCVTFRVFSVVLLGVDPDTLTFANVQRVTGAITEYYKDREGRSVLAPENQSIFDEWLPPERFRSSLDNILPAYEALWRVVATIVVICEEDETKVSRWVMMDFRDNPRDRQYTASFGHGKSASAITEDAFGRLMPIARPLYATSPDWALDCIQYVTTDGDPPTVQEVLKYGTLLAAMVVGRVGVHYTISGDGGPDSQLHPWDQRKISGVRRGAGQLPISSTDGLPHASTSRQAHNGY